MSKSLIPKSKAKTAYGLLSEIAALALEEPKRMRMGVYRAVGDPADSSDEPPIGVSKWPACGTVGCIAGWINTLRPQQCLGVFDGASTTLGISNAAAISLFHDEALCLDGDQGSAKHARKVVSHIRRFQRRHKAQLLAKRIR